MSISVGITGLIIENEYLLNTSPIAVCLYN